MNSEIIYPFVEAAARIIEDVSGSPVKRGGVFMRVSPVPTLEIASVVGMIGEVEGRMLIDLSRKTACGLAGKMNGIVIEQYDDLVTSTINELANMISGRAVSDLVNKGHKLEITPPTLFSGKEMEVSNNMLEMVVIKMETEFGTIMLNIGVKER